MSKEVRTALVVAVLLAFAVSGCAGTQPRPESKNDTRRPTGVLEALQAYQSRDAESRTRPKHAEPPRSDNPKTASPAPSGARIPPNSDPLPTREPAQILRIWIAPWEDAAGNLHGASHVFTEIVPSRWRIAAIPGAAATPVLTPLQIEPRKTPDAEHTTKP